MPVLANLTEFGVTPSFTASELAAAGVRMILYPLSAFRAMSNAALEVYRTILQRGTQESVLHTMQTREELYAVLDYHSYERKLDALFARDGARSPPKQSTEPSKSRQPVPRRGKKRGKA